MNTSEIPLLSLTRRHFFQQCGVGLGTIGEIARQDMDAATEIGRKLIEDFTSGARKGDGSSLRVQNAGDAAANRAGGSRDQYSLPGKFKHDRPRERATLNRAQP